MKDVAYLTWNIGVLLAGPPEKEAAFYLRERFWEHVSQCEIEALPTVCSDVDVTLRLLVGDAWAELPCPCNDLFSFTLVGVPGVTFLRKNTESGKFYHHQPNNTLEVLSGAAAAKLATAGLHW